MSVAREQFNELRKKVFENNIEIVENERYMSADGTKVELNNIWNVDALASNVFYEDEISIIDPEYKYFTEVDVVNEDCLVQAKKMLDKDRTPDLCVLNMTGRYSPGGGVEIGYEGQEEDLFRRSDYFRFLFQYAQSHNYEYDGRFGIPNNPHHQYPLHGVFGGVFSRGVTIFRDTETHGYALLDEPWQVNVITTMDFFTRFRIRRYSLIAPPIVPPNFSPIENHIRSVLRIAYNNGQRRLVLGVSRRYPELLAQYIRRVFDESEFGGLFREICFATNNENDFKTFSDAFLH